ncbi:MAG: hypothetical protein A4E55_02125 [Pelotomaculum sp. PtaU1.Bin035]|nr:MAG: hypothetical protein A4E55_02125 [Pelotomaculum sp. PtaU1.Bin035]
MICPKCKSKYEKEFTVCSKCKSQLVHKLPKQIISKKKYRFKKRLHPSKYLNDLDEWGKHQYNPGYWTGGNIPPDLKYGGKPIGVILLLLGVFSLILSGSSLFESDIKHLTDILEIIPNLTLGGLIGIIMILAGISKLKNTDR